MNDKTKLILALMQVDNITSLVKENEYQKFLYTHLTKLKVELSRQLQNYG